MSTEGLSLLSPKVFNEKTFELKILRKRPIGILHQEINLPLKPNPSRVMLGIIANGQQLWQ